MEFLIVNISGWQKEECLQTTQTSEISCLSSMINSSQASFACFSYIGEFISIFGVTI